MLPPINNLNNSLNNNNNNSNSNNINKDNNNSLNGNNNSLSSLINNININNNGNNNNNSNNNNLSSSGSLVSLSRKEMNLNRELPPPSPFKKKICGDIFGSSMGGDNSMLGMLYRSRVQEKMMKNASTTRRDDKLDENLTEDRLVEQADIFDGSSESENEVDEVINPRHRLALTIRNWSVNPVNDDYLLQEGAVHALIALAGTDDHRIKQCCASALYHLSCRENNRAELMALGSATGVITIAMSVRHWKIAKLCAQTLCNLSMQPGGESTLAKEGAVLALVILLGIRNQRLAPTCVQTLYNLTCVKENFKGMERIVKALLTLPNVTFDATPAIVGGIRNCSRFSSLRMRIIEDGVLQTFSAVINSLSHRENIIERNSIVLNISTCIAQLSEHIICRGDMISKGAIELLQQLLPYCNEQSRLLVIKSLHNLLSMIHTSPSTIFEIGVNVVTDVINQTYDEITLQYAAACFHLFIKENMRGIPRLAVRVVKALPRLLLCSNPLSQFYSIITTSMMFFSDLIEDTSLLMVLASKAVQAGYTVRDPSSIRALVQAFAQLTQETKYIKELEKEKLLNEMLNLNLTLFETGKNDPRIMESCCVGVCRMALQIKDIDDNKRKLIANMLYNMLDYDDSEVLCNAISSIRALLENGICHDELLSDLLISRIANITVRYYDNVQLTRFGCAVLTVLSYDRAAHTALSTDNVLSVLFQMTRCDDILTRELVATCLCNISIDEKCRINMIEKGVVDVIASLSGATSERIQELCAKSICNLTCTVEMHSIMILNNILQTTLMICLVRSVSNSTKQLCARALLNLISDENMESIIDAGVVRAFSTMSLLDDSHTQYICARGFLMLSATEKGRQTIVQKRSVLQSLFGLVKAYSGKTRVLMGMAVFNLLADSNSRQNVIRAGALSVLKIIATLEYENLREGTARVIIILAQSPELEKYVSREPIVPVLVLITKTSTRIAFECALNAFSCLSQSNCYRKTLIEKGCISALVGAVIEGKVNSIELAEEICRCFCLLSLSKDHSEDILESEHIMLALHVLHKNNLCSKRCGEMIGMLLRNLSCTSKVCKYIVEQDGLSLLFDLMNQYAYNSNVLISSSMLLFHNLGKDSDLHERLIQEGMMIMIHNVTEIDKHNKSLYNNDTNSTVDDDLSVEPLDHDNYTYNNYDDSNLNTNINSESENNSLLLTPQSYPVDIMLSPNNNNNNGNNNNGNGNIKISKSNIVRLNQDTIYDIVMAIQLVSLTPSCRELIVQGLVIKIFLCLLKNNLNDVIRHEMVCALNNLASSRECREELVNQGAIDILVILSQSPYIDTQSQCSMALGHLSENTQVKSGTVASLLLLALKSEDLKESQQNNPGGNNGNGMNNGSNTNRRGSSITSIDNNITNSLNNNNNIIGNANNNNVGNNNVNNNVGNNSNNNSSNNNNIVNNNGNGNNNNSNNSSNININNGINSNNTTLNGINGNNSNNNSSSTNNININSNNANNNSNNSNNNTNNTNNTNTNNTTTTTTTNNNNVSSSSNVTMTTVNNHSNIQGQGRDALAVQSIKSLRVMIRDGLIRKRDQHGIYINDDDNSSTTSLSIGSFRGTSLEDLNKVGYLHLTNHELTVIKKDYKQFEYTITIHPISQENGGMSNYVKVDLPYPTVSMRDVEKDDRTGDLIEVKISDESLPKNIAETKIHELTRYASTASEANDDDELHRSWSNAGVQKSSPSSAKRKKKSRRQTLNHAKSLPESNKLWKDAITSNMRKDSTSSPTQKREGTS